MSIYEHLQGTDFLIVSQFMNNKTHTNINSLFIVKKLLLIHTSF